MISLSAAILVATCTATFGLHSSSSTTSSYSYFAFGSALRSRTARSAELRPPRPLTETPPVSGPINPTLTLSLASAVAAAKPSTIAAMLAATQYGNLVIRSPSSSILPQGVFWRCGIVARGQNGGKGIRAYLCRDRRGRALQIVGVKRKRAASGPPFGFVRLISAVVLRELLSDPVEPRLLLARQRSVEAFER